MRLRTLALGLVALLLGAAPAHAGTGFEGAPAHDGYSPETIAPPLARAWHRDLDGSPGFPISADGRVFVIASGTLYALDRATGATLWRRNVAGFASGLAYDGGRVFVITGERLAQAIDPVTGAAQWTVRLKPPTLSATQPVAGDGKLYTVLSGNGAFLHAVDQATGALAWDAPVSNLYDTPALDADRVYVSDGTLEHARSTADGAKVWSSTRDYYANGAGTSAVHAGRVWTNRGEVRDAATGAKLRDYRSSQIPAFTAGGLAILADQGALTAVDEATGEAGWARPLDGGVVSPPLVVGTMVFAVSGAGKLEAVDAATGAPLGRIKLDEAWAGGQRTAGTGLGAGEGTLLVPVRNGLSAYVPAGQVGGPGLAPLPVAPLTYDPPGADDDARAYQQDAAHTGSLPAGGPVAPLHKRWEAELVTPLRTLIADGKVITLTPDGDSTYHLRGLDARDGRALWRARIPQDPTWRPDIEIAYDAGRVLVVADGHLRAFDAATGEALWTSGDFVQTGPIAFGGLVYVATDIHLEAYRITDGTLDWSVSTGQNAGMPASDGSTLWMGQLCGGWDGWNLATRTRIEAYTPCGGGGTGDPVAMKDGLVLDQEAEAVWRSDSAALVDGLRADTIPALAHGQRFWLSGGVLDAAPAAGGPLRWRFGGDAHFQTPPLVVGRQV